MEIPESEGPSLDQKEEKKLLYNNQTMWQLNRFVPLQCVTVFLLLLYVQVAIWRSKGFQIPN